MTRDLAPGVWRPVVALGGGLIFVLSLVYFVVSYLWRFDGIAPAARELPGTVAFDVALFSAFALHHSLFARTPLKAWVERTIPPELERSGYVWIASVLFLATCAWWQPVPGWIWQVTGPARFVLFGLQVTGAALAVYSASRLGVLRLAGITQVRTTPGMDSGNRLPESIPGVLDDRGPYALVRHPIYFGWLLFVWAAPAMNGTRLVFAATSSLYLVLAVPFEERDLRATFGRVYDDYRRRVRWKMIPFIY